MDKKILIIFLIAIVAFSISCVSAADSNEIVMNSSDAVSISEDVSVDDGAFANPVTSEDSQVVGDPSSDGVWVATTGDDTNDGSQANPVASVSKAVDLAQSGATIHIKEGTYNQGKIGLNKSLSFVGEGKVILNSNGANVFECLENDCTLEFTNLVFTGVSSASGSSCGLRVGGNGNLKVINCTFTDISAKFGAMQLYTTGVADIINSTIKDVTCGVTRGSIVYNSGTGKYNFDNISIINPKLSDSVTGAAVHLRTVFYLDNKEATVTLTNSRITGASGSMMSLIENKGTLTISNTVISNNVIGKTESGINGQYLLYLGNSNFVTALNMTNCIIENNTFGNADTSALAYIFKNSIVNLTYSSIMNNGFSKNLNIASGVTPTVNLDYNWWGTNTYTGDNVNKWVVMSTPETTIDAESGKAIDVSVNFNHYTDASGSIQDLAQSISGINVDFSAVSGTLSKNNVASVDGIATVTYTTTTNDKITAKSGSQSLTIDVVAKQAAADIWVATTGSDDNDGSQASPVATITKAIELAGDGYIIHIADGNYVIDKTLSISKSLTLEGNANTVINGNASRIMEVTADATVVLTNLSFTNGKAVFAGAILNEGKLTISNSNFYSNKATGSSGTIITNKNKLNINNSKFYQNSAARGVVFNQNDAVLVIDNSEFYNNDMTSFSNSYGIVYTTSANATISNTVFRNNAVKWGGAIYATKSSDATIGIVNIINSTFESNSANTGQGGALFVSGGECIVKESMFINNKANPGKYTGGQGGAIYTSLNGNVSVTDSVFKNNQAKLGAVLYLNGGSNSIISYSVLLNNTAEGDYAISNGESASGVATVNYNWWGTNSPKNLVPSTVTLNNWVIMSADPTTVTDAEIGDVKTISVNFNKYSSFGAIKDLSKPLSAIDVEFSAVNGTLTSNLVSTVDGVASVTYTVNGNDQITAKSGSQTLTIEVVAKLPVTDVWVSSTGSDANDGSQDSPVATIAKAIELVAEGYTIHVGEGTYIANSLTIAKSFAMIGSGKVIIDGNASKIMNINENTIVNFTNVAFTNALNNYGGVMQSKGTVNLNNVSIYKNTQKSGSTPTVSSIYNTGVMTIINSNIYENDGYGLIFNSGNLDIINTTISSNNVAKGTTYAFLYIDGGVVNVINSTISDNAARLAGIWLNKGTLNVNNATFENNVVTVGNGGAIHIESDSSTATIKDSKFIGNKANKDGGAIYNKGTLNIETSIFDANAASNGNAGYHGDDIYNSGILTLHYSALLGKGTNKLIYNEGREPSANAQYNWWGTNSNPSTLVGAGLDYDDEPCDDVDVSNWVVMSVDPVSIEKVIVGNEKTLTVNFNHYNANGVIKELAKSIPSINVNFEAVNGTLSSDVAATDNGVASVTYTVKGNDQITVKSGSQTLTVPVTTKELTNIVTNETFFDYFGDDGMLLGDITFDTLIFKGEFSNLGVNVVYVPRAIVINGDNAVLRNIAIMCEQGTTLNNLTLNATNYVADTDGALIYAIGSDVTVNNITIDYNATDGSNNAIAVYASGADNFKLVNSTITFTGNNVDGKVFAQGIKIAKSNNAVVDSNIITTSCPLVDVEYSHWGSIDTDLVFAIGVEKSENVKIINNIVDNSAWTKGNNANFPTFDAFIAHTANNLLIKNNTISHTDLITLKGNSSYIYALDFYESNSVIVEDNRVLLNTTGGKEGAGAAYAVQVTGPYNNFVVKGNNLTTVSNGPNLAVYSQNYYGTTEITVENNWINVTGFAGPADFALVSGMEFQDTVAKAYNNTIYVQNVNEYNDNNNIAGITYVQSTSGSHKFDIQNNTIYSEGKYAVLIKSAENSQIIGNTLYAHELKGDDAAIFKSGTNNIIKDNKPMTFVSDIIIDVNNVWIGKEAVIGVTLNSTATGSVNITVGGKTYTVSLTDGKATLKVSDLVAGVNTVVVNYYGDDNFKYSTNSTTFKVLDGVVTNETFFVYFDEDGLLREEVPFDELVFKGEFSNLVNLISIEKPLKITSDNAVLRNIAFAVLSDNVVLNGLTLISNVSCADNGGTLILVAGNNVNITDMNISYIIKESVDAVAINANGVSNLNVVNSNIFFEACPKDDTLTACAINMEGVSNSFIDGNNITAVLPYLFASNYDYTYFMMGVNTVNPIRMRECTNVTFSKNNVNTTANDGSASFPTLQCMFIVGSKDCVIDGNNFSMIDTVIPAGTSNYLYGINIGYNKNLMISNNDFKMSTAGGKDAAGTAYAIQGVECEVSMIGNNITSVSNGPNLGIYFASMTGGTSELYIANNLINVTGLASASGSWALVSGIEVQNGNAKIYNNTIYTYNVGAYNSGNYMYGISYAQYMYGDRSFDVRNNTVYVDGHYAVSFLNANNCNVTDNFLITRDLAGDAAVEIKAGKNNVVENNYPRSSDLIFNITSEEPGKILINVTIDKKATGNMTIKVNGEEYTVTIVDGSASLTLDNLDNGTYFIETAYGGNTFITESSNSTFFNLGLIESSIVLNVSDIKVGQDAIITANITDGATGTVTFFVNGNSYLVFIENGTATLKVSDLTPGDYSVFAQYNGDKQYTISSNSTVFNVAKLSSKVAINVNNIKVGQDATIRLTLPNVNSGVVSVIVNGKTYNVNIVNTKGTLTVSNLANGTYTVIAKFEGNDMYAASEANTTFSVSKIASTTTVSVSDINATQDAVINIAVPGIASGVVSVTVGDAIYSVAVVDGKGSLTVSGLAAGSYDVVAKFAETDMYLASEANATFKVSKLASTITVAVGDIDATHDAIVNVEVPNVDLGSVTVTIGKTSYNVAIIDGKGTLNVPNLDGATYDVVAKFNGNDKYLASENTTKFTVSKIASNIVVYVKDIDVDGLLVFDAFVSQGATGSVFFRKGLTEVGNHIIDGRATVRWGYMSTAGTYTFEVRYAGDGKFLPFYSTVSANVNKIASSVSVNVNDINVGENAIIYATVSPSGVAGDVKLTIDNKTYTEKISDGVVKFTIPNLTAGKHEISVTYAGNYKYLSSTSSTSINVSRFDSTTHVSVNDINAGENAVINIAVSNGTSGVASVLVGDMSYNVAVVDGKGTLTLSNLIAKSYDVVVKFEGNDVYLPSQDATKFTVSKIVSATNITVSDINVGDDAVIDIAVSNVTSGVISVRVDNTVYNVVIVDGKGTLVVSNLAAGYYTVVAKFAENDMYLASMDTVRFTVSKLASTITVNVSNINVGEDAVIGIAVPEVTSGVASVTVNGKSYNVAIVDGKGTLVVSNLAAGYYTVVAKFAENDMYLASMDTVRFTVSKLASTITVNVSNINVGEDAVIGIAVPEVTSGVASVTVNGKSYNVAIVDGKGSLIVSGLAAGSYDVVAKFAETDMYLASENSAKFTVSKLVISSMDVDVKDIKVGDDAVISVALPEDATGNVIVNVNGKNYTAVVKYGVASVTVSNLANGTYSVSVFYNGDDTYMPMENSTKFTVSKVSDYNMTVDIADIIKGENATITVTTPKDGTGSVVVTINGTDYKGTVTNGTAKVIIPGLDEGTYKVVTFYTGDAKYDSMIVNGTITVNKNTKTTLTMDDVVKYFKGAQNLTAKLVDAFGNPITNATVYFTVNGKVYAKTTDKNGTASMGIGLVPNEYKVNAVFNGTKDYDKATANATVTVKNTVLGNDTTLYFCNGTKYVAKFLDSNGKALANTTVKFNINGVFYTRVTDENGTAGLGIRLNPKSYVITAYNPATGEERANNITVLPRLTAQDLSMKYLDGSTFNATLVDGQGKALAGANITFNVNGVFYHKTTNANGVASLNIRLMAGEYIITSMYDNCWASNKITISA